jgi:acyl-CoA thioesterase I
MFRTVLTRSLLAALTIALAATGITAAHASVSAPRALRVSASGHSHAVVAQKTCKKGYHRIHGTCKKTHAAPPVAYVAMGDSLTAGDGADNEETQSYPALLAAHLPSGTRFLNLGVPGYTLDNAIQDELPQALAAHPRLATVWIGTNDVLGGTCPQIPASCAKETTSFKRGLDHLLSALHAAHVRVFVANLPDFHVLPKSSWCPHPVQCSTAGTAFNEAIATVASRYGDSVMDVYAASKSLWGRPKFVSYDGLHLTTAGYAALAHLFYGVMHAQGALP